MVESKQDTNNSSNSSKGFGLSLSNINPSTLLKNSVSSLSGSVNVSKGVGEQTWVNNQTTLVGRNGGSINVDGTLTNTGAIIGSQSIDSPMIINATEIITTDLKDKDYNKNIGIGVSNITAKLNVPQTDVQHGMGDKRQDTNATFTNTIAYEGGVKVDFDARDINTSLENAQLITRDRTIDQINTSLHTDMLNKDVRQNFVIDFLKTTTLLPQVAKGIGEGLDKNNSYNIFGQLANNLGKNGFNIVSYATGVEKELKDLIANNLNGNGELNLTDYSMEAISSILLPLLKEYGKDFYDIEFVEDYGHPSGMSISDVDGTIFINVRGQGFGDARSMLEQLGHEGLHGTYANRDIDEAAARQLTNYVKIGSGIGVDISAVRGQIQISTDRYNEARMNGDLRDAVPLVAIYAAAYVILSNPKIAQEAGNFIIATLVLMEMADDASDKVEKEQKEEEAKKKVPKSEKGKVGEVDVDELPIDAQKAYEGYTKNGWTTRGGITTEDTIEDGYYGNGNKLLPENDEDGNKINYREHDINNKVPGRGRNSKRFVTGSDGSIYYTTNHYDGFLKIK